MTDTFLSSASREVVIGFDRPFVIIGERINPTGRKALAEEMKAGDFSRVERDVLAQVEAERLEAEYTKHHLAELIQSGGVAGGPALPPATTAETSPS